MSEFGNLLNLKKVMNGGISNIVIRVDCKLINNSNEKDENYKTLGSDIKTMDRNE